MGSDRVPTSVTSEAAGGTNVTGGSHRKENMMESRAHTTWEGDLMSGSGRTSLASGAAGPLAVTWSSRTQASEGRTSP